MSRRQRTGLVGGLLLILMGGYFLAAQFFPALRFWAPVEFSWPLIIVGVGIALLFLGVVIGEPDLAVPASVVGGLGMLLYLQQVTGRWDTWVYAWALIPGFVGAGIILSGVLGGGFLSKLKDGLLLILISLSMFFFFGWLLGGMEQFGAYWPVLLIALGVWLLVQRFIGRKS